LSNAKNGSPEVKRQSPRLFILASNMSHLKERSSKDCLNCGTEVAGRFCQQCGQENVEVKESFFQLLRHFVEDLTHFDGKLWKTVKLLLFKPGSLTKLYIEGKRASYIHPIRMYIFVSAVFFLFMFTGEAPVKPEGAGSKANTSKDFASGLQEGLELELDNDTVNYKTIAAYNAAQQKLPSSKKDNWLDAELKKKGIELNEKYGGDNLKIGKALIEKFENYFSRMLYISLPIFAFFIWVLYRRNKNHFFVDHIIFSIHIYCAFYIILFITQIVSTVNDFFSDQLSGIIAFIVPLSLVFYLYKSLKNHFNQSRKKTLLKCLILILLTMFLMATLMVIFFMFSLFNI
jgi:flagellar basal body-associated protein FliL